MYILQKIQCEKGSWRERKNGVTAPRTIKGTWKQSGNDVRVIIGNSYSVLQGTLEDSVMKGNATNQEGVSWNWTLFKKE